MKSHDKRLMVLVNLGIAVMVLLILLLIREIFSNAISLFMSAFVAILLPFSIALFISYLVAPLFKLLEKHLKLKYRLLNIAIIFTGLTILLFFLGRFVGLLIYEQGVGFIENDWPAVVQYFDDFFSEDSRFVAFYNWLTTYVRFGETETITLNLLAIFQSAMTVILTIVLVPVFLFFILNDRQRIYEGIMSIFPKKMRLHAIELASRANRVVEEYFNGRFLTMTVMAIYFTVVLLIFGFGERAILFGFILGFFDIVPYVGPTVAIILPVLYSLTETETTFMFGAYAPLAILIANIIGQVIQNNVAQPLIMGRETRIHPLLILSAFVFFTYLFGIVGLILAIPITGFIKSAVSYWKELNQEKLELDEEEKKKIQEATE